MLPEDLDLNLLRSLDHLLACKSVTGAARALGVGQPSMSKHLERLRVVTGDPLLVRSGRSMSLTARAAALAPLVRDALTAASRLFDAPVFEPRTAKGAFVIACGEELVMLIASLVTCLRREAPELDVRMRPIGRSFIGALDAGRIDLALVPDLRHLPTFRTPSLDRFVVRPLRSERFVVVSARRTRWSLARFVEAGHVLPTVLGDNDGGLVDALLAREGKSRRVVLTVPSFSAALSVVANSDLIATVPESVVAASGHALHVAVPPVRVGDVVTQLVWHPRHTTDDRHRFVRALLERLARLDGGRLPPPVKRARGVGG